MYNSLNPLVPKVKSLTVSSLTLGTYNNQYMILNTNRVKLQESLGEGTLYVVEQIPKLVEYSDQTSVLRKGKSFNRSSGVWVWVVFLKKVSAESYHFCLTREN